MLHCFNYHCFPVLWFLVCVHLVNPTVPFRCLCGTGTPPKWGCLANSISKGSDDEDTDDRGAERTLAAHPEEELLIQASTSSRGRLRIPRRRFACDGY